MQIEIAPVKHGEDWNLEIRVLSDGDGAIKQKISVPMNAKASIGQCSDLEKVLNAFILDGELSDQLGKTGSLLDFFKAVN